MITWRNPALFILKEAPVSFTIVAPLSELIYDENVVFNIYFPSVIWFPYTFLKSAHNSR